MKRRLIAAPVVAALCAVVFFGLTAAAGAYSNNFDTDVAGWFDNGGTITQQPSGYANPAYADGIASASDGFHARLDRTTCAYDVPQGGIGPSVNCSGPYTQWGGYGNTWNGPYQTQVDIYLDAAYANNPANDDSSVGNLDLITDPTNPAEIGTRFDYTSAINNNTGSHLRDFGFVVGTGQTGNTCTGWVVNAQMNVNRNNAFPDDASKSPECITGTGWFTFKHSFFENGDGNLEVLMQIIDVDTSTVVADWSIVSADGDGPDHISTVGCNRYGWFSNQEIFGLPIDNASMTGGCAPAPPSATLNVTKFYDANANGVKDGAETDISDWKVQVANGSTQVGTTPFTASGLAPGDYIASEFSPNEANWIATTPTSIQQTLAAGDDKSVSFGNLCTGPGGGLTIGFWGNKNGKELVGQDDLQMLRDLNLRNADGSNFDPTTYAQLKTWLSKATATNMAYMLSAQLAAMALNVYNGNVSGLALVYAPGVTGANAAGFITVNALMAEANNELLAHNVTLSGSPYRSYQETLKNALDQANQDNSTSFVQPGPCAFSFPPGPCEAGTGNAGAGYNAIPTDVEHCSPPSEGFEANSDNEFGDRVTLNTAGGTKLVSMTVDFQSYGCETSGHWNTGNCLTPAVAGTFTVPGGITAKIYSVVGGNLGPVIATSNVLNPNVPFRPSAIPDADCPNAPADPSALNSRFKDAVSGQCVYSLSVPLTFTFPAGTTFSSGQEVVWTVQFNTTHAGYSPIGEATACFPTNTGCGYDSLNVGAKSYPNAPYAGTDVDANSVYRSHGNANYGGPFVALSPESGWAGYRPLGKIVLGP